MKKRYGISSWIVGNLTANEAIERMAASGFKAVELSGAGPGLLQAWEDDPADVCRKLSSVDVHVPFMPGEGRIDWDAFISELDACIFQGGRILEISPPETGIVERLRKAAALRDVWEGREY